MPEDGDGKEISRLFVFLFVVGWLFFVLVFVVVVVSVVLGEAVIADVSRNF